MSNVPENNPEKLSELFSTMDADVWAREFCRFHPGADLDDMRGWFANAIMVGHDIGRSRLRSELEEMSMTILQTHNRC